MAEYLSETGPRSSDTASVVRSHRLSDPGRSLRRSRSRHQAGYGSNGCKGSRTSDVRSTGQLRPEANRAYSRYGLGPGVGSTVAAGDGDGGWLCLEWPDL